MTHRSNPHSFPNTAHGAAQPRAGVAQAKRIDINVALASLVVVVVLITTLTGAG